MEKSFDEITVSSLSDLQLGSSSEYQSQNQNQPPGDHQVQQVQRNSNSNSSVGNGNENNLNRQKRSSKQQQQSVFNPSRHLDVWLANAIRGLENANSSGGHDSDLLDSPTLLKGGGFGEPLSLPPNLGYLDVPNSSSSPTTGIFSPTQQQQLQQLHQQHQLQQSQQFLLNPASPYLQRGGGGAGYATSFPSSEGIEFASLPPRISHNQQQYQQYQQYQQQQQQQGRRAGSNNQSASSFQDLLNAQRSMADPYINDSSDNESKNGSCTTKSKLESAEALLADLNLLNTNNGTGNVNTNASNTIPNGNNNGLNGTSTTTGNNSNTNTNNSNNGSSNSNNNLVLVLLKEISKLHETNKKICRNLHETKVEMEALKHAPHWGLSHRRDSISGLSTNSQPIGVGHHHLRYSSSIGGGGGGGGGLHSPAPTYHSQGNYTPGIVSDVVREIREVSRVREEALMDRMKTLIEERSWAVNETNFRLLKETEDMKKSIHSVRSEMHQFMDRMLKLENEVITLKGQLSHVQQQQQQQQQVQHQNSFVLRERDSYGQGLGVSSSAAAAKFRRNSMHLNYGRINSTDEFYGNNFNDVSNELRFSNGSNSGGTSTGNSRINAGSAGNKFGENNFATSCSSSLVVNGGGFGGKTGAREDRDNLVVMHVVEDSVEDDQDVLGDVNVNSSSDQVLALEKDALKLRRELQDALASKQESESRITALESIVSTLKEQVPPAALTAVAASTAAQQQHPHHHSQLLLTSTSSTSNNLNPAGTSNYFRAINSGSPQQQQGPGTVSPKLQKAAQVQSLASPSSKQQQQHQHQHQQQFQQRFLDHSTIPSGVMNVTGPVTDL